MGTTALDSMELESYGLPGTGRWITVYANAGHAWIVVAGIAFDTADYGGTGMPAGSGPRWRAAPSHARGWQIAVLVAGVWILLDATTGRHIGVVRIALAVVVGAVSGLFIAIADRGAKRRREK